MAKQEFINQQAEAFLNYVQKNGGNSFDFWADSKSFADDDKQAIKDLLNNILHELRNMRKQNSPWFNVDEVADYLGLKVNTIYQYINQKRIPYRKVPGSSRLIFSRLEIDAWIKNGPTNQDKEEVVESEVDRIWNNL